MLRLSYYSFSCVALRRMRSHRMEWHRCFCSTFSFGMRSSQPVETAKRNRKIDGENDDCRWMRIQWQIPAAKVHGFYFIFIFLHVVRKESVTNKLIISLLWLIHFTRRQSREPRGLLSFVFNFGGCRLLASTYCTTFVYVSDHGLINKFYVCIRVSWQAKMVFRTPSSPPPPDHLRRRWSGKVHDRKWSLDDAQIRGNEWDERIKEWILFDFSWQKRNQE